MFQYHIIESHKRQNATYRGEYVSREELMGNFWIAEDELADMETLAKANGRFFISLISDTDLTVTWQEDGNGD